MLTITVEKKVLSDRSSVFDVYLGNICLPCVDESSAILCADQIYKAIVDHANVDVNVVHTI